MKAVIALLTIMLTGCAGSDPAQYQYYRFDSALKTTQSPSVNAPRVYVDEVNIVGVADQQALVQYTSEHTVHIASYHYWAEHPKLILTKETLQHLEGKGLSPVLSTHASDFNTGDFKLLIEVSDLAGHYQQGAVLRGAWHLYQITNKGTRLIRVKRFDYQSALSQDGFTALISAHQANWQLLMTQLHSEIGASDIISPAD
ncbi:PqiC family protein [Pseudoalteromonas rubra]|uniref:ABC-type transport auxiliary lipoprotein component domain-containing protein n=1 Tax=Pseudoalteromonas rubra TaxID=43658 RepID=A0A0U2PEK0_9GAMM|nr:PqiC family protein [Pseudoalteromonas rubra]ALU45533.1 hypothetical protein AT705_21585 [Pseudoalteromonas rubra]